MKQIRPSKIVCSKVSKLQSKAKVTHTILVGKFNLKSSTFFYLFTYLIIHFIIIIINIVIIIIHYFITPPQVVICRLQFVCVCLSVNKIQAKHMHRFLCACIFFDKGTALAVPVVLWNWWPWVKGQSHCDSISTW